MQTFPPDPKAPRPANPDDLALGGSITIGTGPRQVVIRPDSKRVDLVAELQAQVDRHGPCSCALDLNPSPHSPPEDELDEFCPLHGRSYAEVVEFSQGAHARQEERHAAELENARQYGRDVEKRLAEVKHLVNMLTFNTHGTTEAGTLIRAVVGPLLWVLGERPITDGNTPEQGTKGTAPAPWGDLD